MIIVNTILLMFLVNFHGLYAASSYINNDVIGIIEEIINSNSTRKLPYVHFLLAENYIKDLKTSDFIAELLKKLSETKAVLNVNENFLYRLAKKRIQLCLMLLQSMQDFERIIGNSTDSRFNYNGYYLMLFEKAEDHEVQKIFQKLWDLYIHNINLIRFINETYVVETFVPFSQNHCNKTTPMAIAKFQNRKFIQKPNEFFLKKFQNFHNCSLNLVTFASLAPSVLKRDFQNGSFKLYGRDIETMKMLAHELNFYSNITFLHTYGSWGVLYPNGSTSGAMGRAQRRESDMTWGNLNLKLDRSLILDFSFGYYLETLIFVIPKGEPFSPFMKLLRPFDNFVWISLLLIIIICIFIIVLLSFQPPKIRNFVYGEKINRPFMNVLIAIYGGSQKRLPNYNFARTLLMMFLIFCLVLRSLYQGSLFQFLQANDNQPEVSSIEEMSEKNYKFYLIPSYDDMTKDNVAMKNKRVIIQPSELKTIMDNTLDVYYKGSLLVALSEILYKNKLKARYQEQLYTVCKEPFTMIPISIYYPKNSYLKEPLDEKLIWYQCSGLMSYWASHEMDYKYMSYTSIQRGPKSMSVQHLSGTFQIWILACALSILIFFAEVLWNARKFGLKKSQQG